MKDGRSFRILSILTIPEMVKIGSILVDSHPIKRIKQHRNRTKSKTELGKTALCLFKIARLLFTQVNEIKAVKIEILFRIEFVQIL